MLPDDVRVGRDVHAVQLVVGHVAVQPLDLRPEGLEHTARLLRCGLEVGGRLPLVLYALNGVCPLALALVSGMTTAALVGAAAMTAFAAAPWLAGGLRIRAAATAPLEAR